MNAVCEPIDPTGAAGMAPPRPHAQVRPAALNEQPEARQ